MEYVLKEQEDLTGKPRGTNSLVVATIMTPPKIAMMHGESLNYNKDNKERTSND